MDNSEKVVWYLKLIIKAQYEALADDLDIDSDTFVDLWKVRERDIDIAIKDIEERE